MRMALITLGERRMPCLARLSISLDQSVLSKIAPVLSSVQCSFFNESIFRKKSSERSYLTVTDFAKLRGMSGL